MITYKIEETIKKYNMLNKGETVAVGVSGGADSMLLLNYLYENREKYGINIIAANVEHGIRGEASVKDSRFVCEWCKTRGIEFKSLSINAPQEAKSLKMGVEEYSRMRRYEFFEGLNADKIATAHSLSDNVETVLFRLARGTSAKGMCGIPPIRGNIIRPLIECTSKEIRAYCIENGIDFVVDETNTDNAYSRNYLRNEIVPLLERLNPDFENAVNRFIKAESEDEAALSLLAEEFEFPPEIKKLRTAQPAVCKRVIRLYAESLGFTLDEKHINSVYGLVFKNGRTQLKGEFFAVSDGEYLRVMQLTDGVNEAEFITESKTLDKEKFLNKCELLKKEFAFYCDCDKIVGNIAVRQRLPQDKISLAGRGCTKTLKKLFNELKIPEEERCLVPVIEDEAGIIGVYGYAVSQRVAPDEGTKNYYLLKISLEDIF